MKYITVGSNYGYRKRKNNEKASTNIIGYISYRQIPFINSTARLSVTSLRNNYLKGQIYRLKLYKDLIPAKLFSEINFSHVDYKYQFSGSNLLQNIAEVNLSWRINRKFSFSANYEGTFEKSQRYTRIYLNLIQRF
ncbi:hypothetical protein [Ancylomarina longa]|uniref:DUF560 domain-containing protein n=1 Tax=Ancylomarina longa TaxID=2487017 RepID=A0A434AFU5_9BACT|nr:hypothetical protein [Ancylomarina longa]RUT73257.1 hypothetical protein DLK05_14355 [Ancylomarina longa]